MNVFASSVSRVWREQKYKYRLLGGECKGCGTRFYPYRRHCYICGSEDVKIIELPRKGRLITYTIIYSPPSDFHLQQPYIVGIVELDDGTRVLAQVTDIHPEEVKNGLRVEAVFRKYREQGEDGIIEYGIKFRPSLK